MVAEARGTIGIHMMFWWRGRGVYTFQSPFNLAQAGEC
jgi:hypothetical protein